MSVSRRVTWGVLSLVFISALAVGFGFWRAGYRAYVIHTGSMESTLVPGDLIIDRPATDGYGAGQIITFRHSAGPDLVTHRITDITATGIHTKGDANRSADVWEIPPASVQGSVRWQLPGFGYAVTFLKQPTGFAAVVCALIGLMLLWGLFFPPAPEKSQTDDVQAAMNDEDVPANPWTEPPPREISDRSASDQSAAHAKRTSLQDLSA